MHYGHPSGLLTGHYGMYIGGVRYFLKIYMIKLGRFDIHDVGPYRIFFIDCNMSSFIVRY